MASSYPASAWRATPSAGSVQKHPADLAFRQLAAVRDHGEGEALDGDLGMLENWLADDDLQ